MVSGERKNVEHDPTDRYYRPGRNSNAHRIKLTLSA